MSSPANQAETAANETFASSEQPAHHQPATTPPPHDLAEPALEEDDLVADPDADSAFSGSDGAQSETQSLASVYKGYFLHGRRYQNLRPEGYLMPNDEQQWESSGAGHMLFLILDSQRANTLFRSPISAKAQNVLDCGTGSGEWAMDVADRYPHITVHAVDLYPPPHEWTAPNCIYEVDDITKSWTFPVKFDLVHIRHLLGSMNVPDWKALYKRAYDNLQPGGWIEHLDGDINICCDDGSMPASSMLATQWGAMHLACGERADRPLDMFATMKARIEEAGFVKVQEQVYKCPIGEWPNLQVYKDAGRVGRLHLLKGMEGWVMWLLTNYGAPEPWSPEKVQVYLAGIRREIAAGWHIYQKARRVWAQKPYDKVSEEAKREHTVVDLASGTPSPGVAAKKQRTEEGGVHEA